MKYIDYFSTLTDSELDSVSWEKMMEVLRSDFLKDNTLKYRALLLQHDRAVEAGDTSAADSIKKEMGEVKRKCPAVVCQVTLEGGKDKSCITAYTGYVMVDLDHVPADRMKEVFGVVAADAHTFVAYTTISGRGIRVIARVEDKVTEENYRSAWLSANEHYKRITGLDYDTQCGNVTRLCGLAWDPKAVYKPLAKRIKVNVTLDRKTARKGKGAGRPPKAKNIGQKVMKMVEADGAKNADGCHNDYVSRCIYLMNRYGVTLDDCTSWALGEFEDYAAKHPGQVQSMVRSVYQTHSNEHATLTAASINRKASVKEVEDYISARYKIRLNQLSNKLEHGKKPQPTTFNFLDDRFVNSLWRQMQHDGLNVELPTILNILGSDFSEPFHPFKDWIGHLPEWDGKTDYIRQFFSMVHCKDISEEDFFRYTRYWFLSMVATVMFDEVINHCILTFIGPQGTYKSTFMLHILPPHLRSFFTTKSNSYQLSKDDRLMLAQNIIVSLEEIDSMTTKEINQLKAFVTLPSVNERPPYAHTTVLMPRVASLTATGNNLTFLTDQTGNRRWLPFHIESIDNPWAADIPYEGMYAQALALIKGGERYWLDDADIRRLNDHNRHFMAPDPATELLVTYFMHPRTEAETKYMTASKIAARFAPYMKIIPNKIGQALTDLGYEQVRTHNGRFWKVAERPQVDIDNRIPGADEKPEDPPF